MFVGPIEFLWEFNDCLLVYVCGHRFCSYHRAVKELNTDTNPFESPKTFPTKCNPGERLLFADGQCPKCGEAVTNLAVINVAWKYYCLNCRTTLKVEYENERMRWIEKNHGLIYLIPLVISALHGFDDTGILIWITVIPIAVLAVVIKLWCGKIACKREWVTSLSLPELPERILNSKNERGEFVLFFDHSILCVPGNHLTNSSADSWQHAIWHHHLGVWWFYPAHPVRMQNSCLPKITF